MRDLPQCCKGRHDLQQTFVFLIFVNEKTLANFFPLSESSRARATSNIAAQNNNRKRFCLCGGFYSPVNPMGSCRAQSVYLTTRLLGRLSPLSG